MAELKLADPMPPAELPPPALEDGSTLAAPDDLRRLYNTILGRVIGWIRPSALLSWTTIARRRRPTRRFWMW